MKLKIQIESDYNILSYVMSSCLPKLYEKYINLKHTFSVFTYNIISKKEEKYINNKKIYRKIAPGKIYGKKWHSRSRCRWKKTTNYGWFYLTKMENNKSLLPG